MIQKGHSYSWMHKLHVRILLAVLLASKWKGMSLHNPLDPLIYVFLVVATEKNYKWLIFILFYSCLKVNHALYERSWDRSWASSQLSYAWLPLASRARSVLQALPSGYAWVQGYARGTLKVSCLLHSALVVFSDLGPDSTSGLTLSTSAVTA